MLALNRQILVRDVMKCAFNAPDHTREAGLGEEGLFDHSFPLLIRPNNEHMLGAYKSL